MPHRPFKRIAECGFVFAPEALLGRVGPFMLQCITFQHYCRHSLMVCASLGRPVWAALVMFAFELSELCRARIGCRVKPNHLGISLLLHSTLVATCKRDSLSIIVHAWWHDPLPYCNLWMPEEKTAWISCVPHGKRIILFPICDGDGNVLEPSGTHWSLLCARRQANEHEGWSYEHYDSLESSFCVLKGCTCSVRWQTRSMQPSVASLGHWRKTLAIDGLPFLS